MRLVLGKLKGFELGEFENRRRRRRWREAGMRRILRSLLVSVGEDEADRSLTETEKGGFWDSEVFFFFFLAVQDSEVLEFELIFTRQIGGKITHRLPLIGKKKVANGLWAGPL